MSTSGRALEIDVTPARNRSAASRDGSQPAAGEDVGDAKRRSTLERNSSSGSQEASVSRNASWMMMSTPSLSAVGRNVSTIFGSGPAARTVAVASHGDISSSAAWRWPSAVSPHVEGGVAASTADRQCRTRTKRTRSEYGWARGGFSCRGESGGRQCRLQGAGEVLRRASPGRCCGSGAGWVRCARRARTPGIRRSPLLVVMRS